MNGATPVFDREISPPIHPQMTVDPQSEATSLTNEVDLFLDRRMVAIVFVDIASSTSKLVEMTDRAWCGVLDALEARVQRVVAQLGGTISNRMGDGYLIVFDGVSRAVRFGQLITSQARDLELELRVGIHAGEIEQQGHHIAGVAVHTAARVQAIADPGEIVVTEPVMSMSFGSGLDFLPRGEQELRGLPGRWRLWTVAG
jgi:class 3 adenylate cyclase